MNLWLFFKIAAVWTYYITLALMILFYYHHKKILGEE